MAEPSQETQEKTDDPDTSAEAPPSKWDIKSYSPNKKRILFGAMCIFHIFTFVFFNLPYSYLPLYNEDRKISDYWTGLILGAASFGLMISCVFIAPTVISKFSTRIVLSGCFSGLATSVFLFAMLDFIKNSSAYEILAIIIRFIAGIFGGIINVAVFAAYVAIYPEYVATVTAIGEAVLNGAVAFGPFLGGVLYKASGFILAAVVPGSLILISAVPAFFLPSLNSKKRRAVEESSSLKTILDPWVLFPLWHLASSQILITYHMPLLSKYVEEAFNADVVWAGTALLVSTAVICLSSPFLGLLIDKFGPCTMMIASSVSLPLVYAFVGPLPLLSFVAPSRTQLLLSLAFLGLAVPMACISALPVMFQVYQSRNQGKLPILVINTLVSLYCASYPLGIFIGTIPSGFIEPYASFGWSTGTLGLIYIAQSLICIIYCINVMRSKNAEVEQDGEGYVMENPVTDSKM